MKAVCLMTTWISVLDPRGLHPYRMTIPTQIPTVLKTSDHLKRVRGDQVMRWDLLREVRVGAVNVEFEAEGMELAALLTAGDVEGAEKGVGAEEATGEEGADVVEVEPLPHIAISEFRT